MRVKLAAGGKISPHTHPDERYSTVLSPASPVSPGNASKPWWEQLFKTGSAVPNAAINPVANLNAMAGTDLTRTGTASESAPQAVAKVAR